MMSSHQETVLLLEMQLSTTNDQLNAKHELLKACNERLRECTQSLKESEEQKKVTKNIVAQLMNQIEVLQVQERATKEMLQTLK